METIVIVFAGKRDAIVAERASSLDSVNLARFIATELAEVAFVSAYRNADLFLVASELILNVTALRIATNVHFIN